MANGNGTEPTQPPVTQAPPFSIPQVPPPLSLASLPPELQPRGARPLPLPGNGQPQPPVPPPNVPPVNTATVNLGLPTVPQTPAPGQVTPPSIQQPLPPVQEVSLGRPRLDVPQGFDPAGRNNPGNIRVPGSVTQFQSFATPEQGVQAIRNNLLAYQDQHGLNTVAGIISRWAPPNENDTPTLIENAARRMGIGPNQPIDLHDPATMQRMVNAIVEQEQGGSGMARGYPRQQLVAPEARDPDMWGKRDPRWDSNVPGMMPHTEQGVAGLLQKYAVPLLGIVGGLASPAVALAAFNGMNRAKQQKQLFDFQMQKDRFELELEKQQNQMQLEAQDAGDAMGIYADNPDGLMSAMRGIANKYDDGHLRIAAEMGPDAVKRLLAKRDELNQPLMKLRMEQERLKLDQARVDAENRKNQLAEADRAAVDRAVAEDDAQYLRDHPDATQGQRDQAHYDNLTKRLKEQDPTKAGADTLEASKSYDIVKDGKVVRTVETRERKDQPGMIDSLTGQPIQLGEGESLQPHATSRAAATPQGQAEQIRLDAARAATNAALPGVAPDSPEYQMRLADELNKRASRAGAGGAYQSKELQISDDQGNTRSVVAHEMRDGSGWVEDTTNKPLQLQPNEHIAHIAAAGGQGTRASQLTSRQITGAEEVAQDLSNAMKLPVGTTMGPSGLYHPDNTTVFGVLKGTLSRVLTRDDQAQMEYAMTNVSRMLSILESPVYSTQGATELMARLMPVTGDNIYKVLSKFAAIRQNADRAISTMLHDPAMPDDRKKELRSVEAEIAKAVPFSFEDVINFAAQGHPRETFADYVQRVHLGQQQPVPSGGRPAWVDPQYQDQGRVMPDGRRVWPRAGKWYYEDNTPVT